MFEWSTLTSAQIPALDRNLPVIIPIGLVEAHGPHLPLSVDMDSAAYFSRRIAKESGAILAPLMPYGFADEMREYPGTVGLRPETLTAVAVDLAEMFLFHGFKKQIWLSGHGANKTPVEHAFYKVWETHPELQPVYWNYWTEAGLTTIHHADKGETEIAVACGTPVFMDHAKDFKVKKPWHKIRSRFELDPASGGINGEPTKADFAEGERMREQVVKVLVEKVKVAIAAK